MKKFLIITLLITAGAALVFASGTNELPGPWTRMNEEVTVTGKIQLTDGDFPVLSSGGKTYELHYPYYEGVEFTIEDGDRITVKGFETMGPPWEDDKDVVTLRVISATIDGKEYVLPDIQRGMHGRGMMGGRRDGDVHPRNRGFSPMGRRR
ncbi:MAG: hypothetical protein ACLFST_14765 [Spirochaetia bacterium]